MPGGHWPPFSAVRCCIGKTIFVLPQGQILFCESNTLAYKSLIYIPKFRILYLLMDVEKLIQHYPLISDQVNKEQVKTILELLVKTIERGIDGDVVEFGCYIGTTSIFIQRVLQALAPERTLHVYDSFTGLPPKTAEDNSPAGFDFAEGALMVSKKMFQQTFLKAHVPLPVIHKGWFSDLTPDDVPAHIAFAFLDGDFYRSIYDSLKLVLPRMAAGGCIVVDDYAREALPGAARAVHELMPGAQVRVRHNLGIIELAPLK